MGIVATARDGRHRGAATTGLVVLAFVMTTILVLVAPDRGVAGPLQGVEVRTSPFCDFVTPHLGVEIENTGLEVVTVHLDDPFGDEPVNEVLLPRSTSHVTFRMERGLGFDAGELPYTVTDLAQTTTEHAAPHDGLWCAEPIGPPTPSNRPPSEMPTDGPTDGGEPAGGRDTGRLSGGDRWTTAVAISRHAWPDGADTVHLVRGLPPLVDALAAGTLVDGPALLVPPCGDVPAAVIDEVARLDPRTVVAVGGEGAVCDRVLAEVADGRVRDRVAGRDRFDTAVAVSRRVFPAGAPVVHLARADEPLVDALAAGTLADGPVLLVPACGDVPATVRDEVDRLDPDAVVALGGTSAVCDDLLRDVADGRPVRRLAGSDRWATAVAISEHAWPDGADVVHLARGVEPLVDALAGGTLTDGPVLLVPPCGDIPDVVQGELTRLDPDRVRGLGGPGSVCDDVLRSAARRR